MEGGAGEVMRSSGYGRITTDQQSSDIGAKYGATSMAQNVRAQSVC